MQWRRKVVVLPDVSIPTCTAYIFIIDGGGWGESMSRFVTHFGITLSSLSKSIAIALSKWFTILSTCFILVHGGKPCRLISTFRRLSSCFDVQSMSVLVNTSSEQIECLENWEEKANPAFVLTALFLIFLSLPANCLAIATIFINQKLKKQVSSWNKLWVMR